MPNEIRANGFAIHSPVDLSPGLWRYPHDRSRDFNSLDYWTAFAHPATQFREVPVDDKHRLKLTA
jgi:hypothetical protein